MAVYYNEFDPKAAAWLRELIKQGHIADGDVDERSIADVSPKDLDGYTQCHFFAGIGGWSYALRLAGVPDGFPVWTGSCPCQPFSAAGKQKGAADERHLWPEFKRLIEAVRPPIVFGEQVASKLGREWLAGVFADLEDMAYHRAAADLCAAGVGAPHIRQRLWWMAYAAGSRLLPGTLGGIHRGEEGAGARDGEPQRCGDAGALANASGGRLPQLKERDGAKIGGQQPQLGDDPLRCGIADGLCNADHAGSQGRDQRGNRPDKRTPWAASVVLPCTDGKTRRIEPSIQPLAHGVSDRVALLRGAGNAIVPQVAEVFIRSTFEALK